ncbi:MAG: hypothetical protein MZV65_39790 [Chromatiales bacterium]|nr:hypothetical protein [Chromatiales bacterium]
MTQAVGYVSGRSEVLCALFFLPAFLLPARMGCSGEAPRWLVAGLGLLAARARRRRKSR